MKKVNSSIFIDKKVLDSDAFWALNVHAIRALMIFYTKRRMKQHKDSKGNMHWPIVNNGEIVFTYKEAVERGMDKKQFCQALDNLIAKGFLEVTYQGTGPNDPSTYKLTERWQAYGTDNFTAAPERRKNKNPKGGWNIYNAKKKQNLRVEIDTSPSVDTDTSPINNVNNQCQNRH